MFRYLIWDVDGTLLDTYPAYARAFELALAELGASAPREWLLGLCRQSFDFCVATLARELNLDAVDLAERFSRHYTIIPPEDQPPFPGAAEVCAYVQGVGGRNFIVTHRGSHSLARLLAVHGMADYFTQCLTADDNYPRKPDPAAFLALLERHDLPRHEVLAVGDRDMDILVGRAAGLRTCRYGSAASAVAADYSIDDFNQLLRLLAGEATL